MSLLPSEAARVLRERLGEPINPVPRGERQGSDNQKVLGFTARSGRVLALNRERTSVTHIWFERPSPPALAGVRVYEDPPINANLSGRLDVLNHHRGLGAELESEAALHRFLDWYGASAGARGRASAVPPLDVGAFWTALTRFQDLIEFNSGGHAFTNFHEGLAAVWEAFKPRVRDRGAELLDAESWRPDEIGSGTILEKVIAAIEIDERHRNLINNLVFWQNRYGHANREHRALLEARTDTRLRAAIEQQVFALYRGEAEESTTFDRLAELTHANYPLLAYLFFLKDMDRFMPIRPTTFDHAFRDLNIDLVTVSRCSWDNYARYNAALGVIRDALRQEAGVTDARLIDAHSFCWMLERLEAPEPDADGAARRRGPDAGRIFGPRDKSIWEMKDSVLQTVKQANGQIVVNPGAKRVNAPAG